uniref:PDZ domain-containing protein n=1 Tax=Schistosoma curassoni TaxID=6186 RepID=A0A183KNQ9_9TREM
LCLFSCFTKSKYVISSQGNKKDPAHFQSIQFSRDLSSNNNNNCVNKLNQQTNNIKSVHVNICDSRHLRRSSTLHEHLDLKHSTNSKDNIRTVILERYSYSSNGIDKNERSSFGLSIRTVKNSSVIAEFTPTTNKPSLQTVKRVVPDSPAEKAGVKVGDFVLKFLFKIESSCQKRFADMKMFHTVLYEMDENLIDEKRFKMKKIFTQHKAKMNKLV